MKIFVVVLLIVGLISSFTFAIQPAAVSKSGNASSSDFWGTLSKNIVRELMPTAALISGGSLMLSIFAEELFGIAATPFVLIGMLITEFNGALFLYRLIFSPVSILLGSVFE